MSIICNPGITDRDRKPSRALGHLKRALLIERSAYLDLYGPKSFALSRGTSVAFYCEMVQGTFIESAVSKATMPLCERRQAPISQCSPY